MSLYQGLDPKSTEVNGLLKIVRHFESTLRCREQPSLALMDSESHFSIVAISLIKKDHDLRLDV